MANHGVFGTWKAPGPDGEIDGAQARDMLVECFLAAHKIVFERQKERMGLSSTRDSVRRSAKGAVRAAFRREGASWDDPSRDDIERVMERLATQSRTWGTPSEVIDRNRAEYEKVLSRLRT